MSGYADDGFAKPGSCGNAKHEGKPLTREELRELAPGTLIVVTWFGGNGPHVYRVIDDPRQGPSVDLKDGSLPHDPHWPVALNEFQWFSGNRATLATPKESEQG